ncbi:hypothetical protein [Lysobacter gummosus]
MQPKLAYVTHAPIFGALWPSYPFSNSPTRDCARKRWRSILRA